MAEVRPTPARLLVDTDVLIDHLRGRPEATRFLLESPSQLLVSAITVAELYAGVREGNERNALEQLLEIFELAAVDADLARAGGLIRRDFSPRSGIGLADAIIAATAIAYDATFCTLNRKHFPMLQKVIIPYRK